MEEEIWLANGNGMGKVLLVYRWDQAYGVSIDDSFAKKTLRSFPSWEYHHIITSLAGSHFRYSRIKFAVLCRGHMIPDIDS